MNLSRYRMGHVVPAPGLVAAWYAVDDLATDLVPHWAAQRLAEGTDGEALRTLAGLDGTDLPAVRELLPDALAETGAQMSSEPVAVSVVYRDLARLHLDGQISIRWLIAKVEQLVVSAENTGDYLDPPLGVIYGFHDEWGAGWGRTEDELTALLYDACITQIGG
jgi:hypothetical protein